VDLIYLIALIKTKGVGVITFYKALEFFGDAQAIFSASEDELNASNIFNKTSIEAILSFKQDDLAPELNWLENEDCFIISFYDEDYPDSLRQIYDPPPILYLRGDKSVLNTKQLAIVGSRNPTTTGEKNAYDFAYSLASDLTITSGMAIGVDAAAHQGALDAGGKTIAICGTGLDLIYPSRNKNLARAIAKDGLLVSEFALGTKAIGANFPRRNRIITGLSEALLVVEATMKSGSMVSARVALEQNKDIFAIPGSIHNPLTSGPHSLIQDGAYLAGSPDDIREMLAITHKKTNKITKEPTQNDNVLLKYLDYDGLSIDDLALKSGLDISEISSLILQLELNGIIEKTSVNTYIIKN
jgi:DNA processing protein